MGRSPRTRGSQAGVGGGDPTTGSIPADAGEPCRRRTGCRRPRVDPRGRGGAWDTIKGWAAAYGRSPRTRGSHGLGLEEMRGGGSIPADAGEPSPLQSSPSAGPGRSPRTRGSPEPGFHEARARRSIPADAGEPSTPETSTAEPRVDPRGRGGAGAMGAMAAQFEGRSPRTRGSRLPRSAVRQYPGSIPADAGEPVVPRRLTGKPGGDPGGGGGAGAPIDAPRCPRGLSPRTRGSRVAPPQRSISPGSIPADAGEPELQAARLGRLRVDPRGRGGAYVADPNRWTPTGRSPRTRGSRPCRADLELGPGSIPADAGEPAAAERPARVPRVDPRGRGGAAPAASIRSAGRGRSPRTRGSLAVVLEQRLGAGSIPADAGEPRGSLPRVRPHRVDPRGRGGAYPNSAAKSAKLGRSPRTRGSPQPPAHLLDLHGSIPADAGEPPCGSRGASRPRVDPRGRGGAIDAFAGPHAPRGRAPRTRGSPPPHPASEASAGSIPADAGEPATTRTP